MKTNSKQLTSAIIAALFFVVALIVYFEMIVPSYASLQIDKGEEQSQNALYDNENKVVDQVKSLITTYNSEASSTQSINLSLPVGQDIAGALAQIFGLAASSGFSLEGTGVSIQATQAPVTTNVAGVASVGGSIVRPAGSVSFQLVGSGTYESLKSFLTGLENNVRLFDVTGISIQGTGVQTKGANPDLFNYTITVMTHYQSS